MRQNVRKVIGIIACSWLVLSSSGSEAAFPEFAIAGFHGGASLTLPDGRRLFVGSSYTGTTTPSYSFAVARFNSDGTPDLSFNGTGLVEVPIWGYYEGLGFVVVQPDGKIIAGGNAADPDLRPDWCHPAMCNIYPALLRLNPDGSVDRSFNGTGRLVISIGEGFAPNDCCGTLTGLQLQADGEILIFIEERKAPVRVNADGTLDGSFVGTDRVAVEVRPPSFLTLGAGLTGTWFDPAQADQGFMLEVLPGTPMLLLATWFTFAPQGGAAWIFGLGPIRGGAVTMQAIQAAGAGARFPPNLDATNVHTVSWGPLTFRFTDCNHGHVAWSSLAKGYGSGAMELTRLTLPAGVTCSQ